MYINILKIFHTSQNLCQTHIELLLNFENFILKLNIYLASETFLICTFTKI